MNNDINKRGLKDNSDETPVYLTPDSTLQSPAEHRHDQSVDPRKDNAIGVSNDDLHETDVDRMQDDLDGTRGTQNNENS